MIQVSWGPVPVQTYPVDIVIKAYDRSGLLRDVSQVLLNERINVLAVNTRSNKEDNTASMLLTIEIGAGRPGPPAGEDRPAAQHHRGPS